MKAAFDGAVSFKPTLKIEGTLAADAPSLRNAVIWAGTEAVAGRRLRAVSRSRRRPNVVGGTISAVRRQCRTRRQYCRRRAHFRHRWTADAAGHARRRCTRPDALCFDRPPASPPTSANGTTAALRSTAWPASTSILRLSAANVVVSNAKLGRTAIAANLRNGHLVLTVGEAQAYGGMIKGSHDACQFRARRRHQIAAAISPMSTLKAASASCSVCVGSKAKAIFRSPSKGAVTVCSR